MRYPFTKRVSNAINCRCEVFIGWAKAVWGMGGFGEMGHYGASQGALDKLEKVGIIEEK